MAMAREEKRIDDPPVTHQIHPQRPFKTLNIYVPRGDTATMVEVLKRAMKNDGSSVSAWFFDRVREWYKGHAPGNPQTPLEKFHINNQKPPSEWKLRELQEKQRGEERWAKLHSMSNDELIARQARISKSPGHPAEGRFMEFTEISLILMHRRLAPSHGASLQELPEDVSSAEST
jgi:hypothetical protein